MNTPEKNLENQLIRLAQHNDSKQGGQQRRKWFRWFKKQADRKFKTEYLAETFEAIFRQMREALGVEEEDLKLENANFHAHAGNVYVFYYHAASPYEVLSCSINDRTLELTRSYGNYQMTINMNNIPRSHSTLSVRTDRKNREISEIQCEELKTLFSRIAEFIQEHAKIKEK